MTIIASFRVGGWPAIFGDALVTEGAENPDVSLPTVYHPNHANKNLKITCLAQKVIIVSPQICLAWSGSLVKAKALIFYLSKVCHGETLSWDEFVCAIGLYPAEDLKGLDYFIYFWAGDGSIGCCDTTASFDINDLVDVHLGGSGTTQFFKTIESVSNYISDDKVRGDISDVQRGLTLALTCAGLHLGRQAFTGHGLDEGWGGFFEVAFFNFDRFVKCTNTLYVFFEFLEIQEGKYRLSLLKQFFFQIYRGDDLYVWTDAAGLNSEDRMHLIVSPTALREPISEGDFREAFRLMFHEFRCASTVAPLRVVHIDKRRRLRSACSDSQLCECPDKGLQGGSQDGAIGG